MNGDSVPEAGPETSSPIETATAPDQIGPYRLLEKLGEGGMGVVYLAEQEEPIVREVALKVIRAGLDSQTVLARFESERQALSLMDHPNIAKVLDAGSTSDGRPYFVMEVVHGPTITEYCDREGADIRTRLELYLQVCAALQHAHQKGIIHRDVKPSNVLVECRDGRTIPKVIDFGVAKAIDRQLTERTLFTEYGVFIGTPEYTSPEQADVGAVDVDTRADVYSLGVLLYELLVGHPPFDPATLRSAGFDAMRHIIRETDPPTPSTRLRGLGDVAGAVAAQRQTDARSLTRQLRDDLDWITIKALEKDRGRRYPSVADLATDVQRHLDHEPIAARPPNGAYRLKKFMRRNRGLIPVIVALLAGVAAAIILIVRWRDDLRRADALSFALTQRLGDATQRAETSSRANDQLAIAWMATLLDDQKLVNSIKSSMRMELYRLPPDMPEHTIFFYGKDPCYFDIALLVTPSFKENSRSSMRAGVNDVTFKLLIADLHEALDQHPAEALLCVIVFMEYVSKSPLEVITSDSTIVRSFEELCRRGLTLAYEEILRLSNPSGRLGSRDPLDGFLGYEEPTKALRELYLRFLEEWQDRYFENEDIDEVTETLLRETVSRLQITSDRSPWLGGRRWREGGTENMRRLATILDRRATALMHSGQYKIAAVKFREVLDLFNHSSSSLTERARVDSLLAECLLSSGRNKEAE